MTFDPHRRKLLHGTLATVTLAACRPPGVKHDPGATTPAPIDSTTSVQDTLPIDGPGDGSLLDTGWADTGVSPPACSATTPFAEGPYFLSDAPDRTDLRSGVTLSGTLFTLYLTVRSDRDCTPLAGAIIELWHCDPDGDYDMTSSDMLFRCRVRTDFAGQVALTTYKPVPYELDGEDRWMPAHFHLKAYAARHEALTTQLRFTGDPHDDGSLPTSLMMTPTVHADGSESAAYTLTLEAT